VEGSEDEAGSAVVVTNYAAHALDQLRGIRSGCPIEWQLTLDDIATLQELIWQSEKFLLPANGELIASEEYREAYFDLLHLPFPVVALEIPVTKTDGASGCQPSKSLLLAWTRASGSQWVDVCDADDAIHFTEMVYADGSWRIRPGYCGFSPSGLDFRGDKTVGWAGASAFPEFFADCTKDEVRSELQGMFGSGFNAIVEFCVTVNCENVAQERIDPTNVLNQKRLSKGKTPFFSYRHLRIPSPKFAGDAHGGTHATPRLHLRRGHLRRLSNGKVTWVRHAMVGSAELGVAAKDYLVR
jgi:hypothetical protein